MICSTAGRTITSGTSRATGRTVRTSPADVKSKFFNLKEIIKTFRNKKLFTTKLGTSV
jgi:hypothetical protein